MLGHKNQQLLIYFNQMMVMFTARNGGFKRGFKGDFKGNLKEDLKGDFKGDQGP